MKLKLAAWVIAGTVLLVFIAITLYLVVGHSVRTTPTFARQLKTPMPVSVEAAKQMNVTAIVGANAAVLPIALVNLTTRLSVLVKKVPVDFGHMVSPGQILVEFDREVLNATVAAAQSEVDRTAADSARARLKVQRITAIYEEGLLPKVELEKAEAELDKAQAEYGAAREKLSRAKEDLQYAIVFSPVSGIIMERLINPGETAQANQKLFTIGRIDQVLVEAKVAEEKVADIFLQQPATVTFNAFPNDLMTGTVVKIKPVTDPETKTFLVDVMVANPNLKLKPGLTGFVRIQRGQNVLAVPSISLINPTGVRESSVFVIGPDSVARLRKVKVGVASDGRTEILDGLSAGEKVVTVGQLYLRDGDRVRIDNGSNEIKLKSAD